MSEEFDAIDELGKAVRIPPKSTRDVLIVDPGRIAELEAEVERLREALRQIHVMADSDLASDEPGEFLFQIEATARAALEPQP